MKENKMLRKSKKELEELKIRNTFPFKYFIIDYSIFLERYVLVNVTLDEERYDGESWYFVLSDEEGWEYQKKNTGSLRSRRFRLFKRKGKQTK